MPTIANNLLSIGVFCDAGCTATFTKDSVSIFNSAGTLILQGLRKTNGARMWRFSLIKAIAANATGSMPTNIPTIITSKVDNDDDYTPIHITDNPTMASNIPQPNNIRTSPIYELPLHGI